MSLFNAHGQRCEHPLRRNFIDAVLEEWELGHPDRSKALAAVLLRSQGCGYNFIARALGYSHRSNAKRLVARATEALRRRFPEYAPTANESEA